MFRENISMNDKKCILFRIYTKAVKTLEHVPREQFSMDFYIALFVIFNYVLKMCTQKFTAMQWLHHIKLNHVVNPVN